MPDGIYDRDFLIWSEQQAELLRRLAAGERLNEQVDWTNLIEEVEGLGRSELHACESLLLQAMIHLIKLSKNPDGHDAAHWQGETIVFLDSALRSFTPSMRSRIDLPILFAKACKVTQTARSTCPFTLDMLLDPDPDIAALVACLNLAPAV